MNGNAVVTSSVLNRSDGATIKGKVTEGTELPNGFILPDKITSNPPATKTTNTGILGFFWNVLSIFLTSITAAILAMLAALFFAEPMRRTAAALIESPLLAAGAGLLTVIAAPIVVVILVYHLSSHSGFSPFVPGTDSGNLPGMDHSWNGIGLSVIYGIQSQMAHCHICRVGHFIAYAGYGNCW